MEETADAALRDAARAWLRAADRLAAANADAAKDADAYAVVLELAEEATLARLRFYRTLVDLGWSHPRALQERPTT